MPLFWFENIYPYRYLAAAIWEWADNTRTPIDDELAAWILGILIGREPILK